MIPLIQENPPVANEAPPTTEAHLDYRRQYHALMGLWNTGDLPYSVELQIEEAFIDADNGSPEGLRVIGSFAKPMT